MGVLLYQVPLYKSTDIKVKKEHKLLWVAFQILSGAQSTTESLERKQKLSPAQQSHFSTFSIKPLEWVWQWWVWETFFNGHRIMELGKTNHHIYFLCFYFLSSFFASLSPPLPVLLSLPPPLLSCKHRLSHTTLNLTKLVYISPYLLPTSSSFSKCDPGSCPRDV